MKLITGTFGALFSLSLLLGFRALETAGCQQPDTCVDNGGCDALEYCAKDVGACDSEGSCETRPDACPAIYDPVCGCDGKTYSSDCVAAASGVNVAYEGECKVTPTECTDNAQCGDGNYCSFASCDAKSGTCAERPDACTKEYAPVCGCDGVTYGNACMAAAAGASVAYEGECKVTTECTDNAQCGTASYCHFASCDAKAGACEARPEACPDIWAPVCGCDGKTYSNDCDAAAAGASIAYAGECKSSPSP